MTARRTALTTATALHATKQNPKPKMRKPAKREIAAEHIRTHAPTACTANRLVAGLGTYLAWCCGLSPKNPVPTKCKEAMQPCQMHCTERPKGRKLEGFATTHTMRQAGMRLCAPTLRQQHPPPILLAVVTPPPHHQALLG